MSKNRSVGRNENTVILNVPGLEQNTFPATDLGYVDLQRYNTTANSMDIVD